MSFKPTQEGASGGGPLTGAGDPHALDIARSQSPWLGLGHISQWSQRVLARADFRRVRTLIPGLLLLVLLALASRAVAEYVGHISAEVMAMVLGMVLVNALRMPSIAGEATGFTTHQLLRLAIILLGAGLGLQALADVGGSALTVISLCIVFAVIVATGIARVLRFPGKVGALLAAGTAICGSSAILVCGPLVKAKGKEIAFAIATIFLFNVVAVLLYPSLGRVIDLSDTAYGIWAGTSVNDTSSVLAASAAFSDQALATATVVKLTRTVFLVPVAVVFAAAMYTGGSAHGLGRKALTAVPWFLGWFLLLVMLNSAGLIGQDAKALASQTARFLIVMVMAAVGLKIRFKEILDIGPRPLLGGLCIAILLSGFSLLVVRALHPGWE